MYEIITLRDKIRVEPNKLQEDRKEAATEIIRQNYIGKIIEEKALLVGLIGIDSIEEGIIIPNDASIYYDTIFRMLAYLPTLHETVKGQVTEVSEIGAIVNIGPLDGLAHISQTMDDFVDFSKNALTGRRTKTTIKTGDTIVASIIAVSTKGMMKVGLTMRSPGLGKLGSKKKEVAKK
ncbi:MAG: RNA polymerase Rpb7 domain protein [Candidatus Parvarchaeum acidiphilum ARMAN-4]|jgi:DNA-directed RNA polymerase subunit E'|uniref:DNA-directed RNA polymerase subunit Rpo7 n=1 Tax=Candidatus Parvarchaeum acidiphilum ARMAN-4 TaxID=662760 RepID=D2EF27_PARA4|nr:MAG: RNA polymerase Rpb7 domain protein [Candidatus Parvarchaeum acidiphilum ARMAN-4]